jgi:drug/metabolite transporter (DMT)-like permease
MKSEEAEIKKGIVYALFSNVLWALFPILTVVTYRAFPSILALAFTTGIASVFFFCLMVVRRKVYELRAPSLLYYIFFITLYIAVGGYGFSYLGLMYTSPGNVSIIGLFEVCTSFLFFNLFHKEAFSRTHMIGAFLMILGASIILVPTADGGINIGSVCILCATIIAPFGNRFQQKARAIASGETIMFLRNTFASAIFFLLSFILGKATLSGVLTTTVLVALFANAILIFGFSKLLFIEAIHRITVTRVIALSSLAPFLTLLIAWVVFGTKPEFLQLIALVPLAIGVVLLTDQFPLRKS